AWSHRAAACPSGPSRSLRVLEPEDLPRLVGSGDLASQPARDARHALDQHGVVLGEFARRDIGIVLIADPHVYAQRDRARAYRPLLPRVHDAHVPDAILRKIIDHELQGALGRRRPGAAGPADEQCGVGILPEIALLAYEFEMPERAGGEAFAFQLHLVLLGGLGIGDEL